MIASLLGWLTGRVAGPVMTAISAALGLTLLVIWLVDAATISNLRSQIDDPASGYRAKLAVAQADSAVCRGRVADQNAALDAFAQVQANKMDAAAKALAAADAKLAEAGKAVSRIVAAKAGPDQCASADALILGSLK
jgi:hypothetical protein